MLCNYTEKWCRKAKQQWQFGVLFGQEKKYAERITEFHGGVSLKTAMEGRIQNLDPRMGMFPEGLQSTVTGRRPRLFLRWCDAAAPSRKSPSQWHSWMKRSNFKVREAARCWSFSRPSLPERGLGPTMVPEIVGGWPVCVCVSSLKITDNIVQVKWCLICVHQDCAESWFLDPKNEVAKKWPKMQT